MDKNNEKDFRFYSLAVVEPSNLDLSVSMQFCK